MALFKRCFAVLVLFVILSHPKAMLAQVLTFTTFAGSNGGTGFEDGRGSKARFDFQYPAGVATDSNGNVYAADVGNDTIRKISPAGAVTTLAGLAGIGGNADGTGSAASFLSPTGVATDSSGNVYVADRGNGRIRKITPAGGVTTMAGSGAGGNADGTGSAASFLSPTGVATDSSGNVYVADKDNHTIRRITPAGVVTTLAGLAGIGGNADGTGSGARFKSPTGVATDSSGNVYVADSGNNRIRKITPAGVVTTLAAFGHPRLNGPTGVATDSSGNVYVADSGNCMIRKVTPGNTATTLAGDAQNCGSADGMGFAAQFLFPTGVATDSSSNVYVADNNTIRKITPTGAVTTLAGLAAAFGSADGTGTAARFDDPRGVAIDSGGNVYVADTRNYTIRKITPAGAVTTMAGLAGIHGSADGTGSAASFRSPIGVATDSSGNVYVSETSAIRKITPAGAVTTLAGDPANQGFADGTGSAARFFWPSGVAIDGGGNVYVADKDNHAIRKVTTTGAVTTLAGDPGNQGSADGTGSAARFAYPHGVATDSSGNLYVADTRNNTIRKITPAGQVTTLAGLAGIGGNADGTGSAAQFGFPTGVATDTNGNIYVADYRSIRKVTPEGVVTTLGGNPHPGNVDGTGIAARFDGAFGVATDTSGNVYVADSRNHTIRVGRIVLADVATIDVTTGPVFVTRQLGTSSQTAISWHWSLIRRPVDSVADLSSATIRNPTFTADVPGLFIFRLVATGTAAASITTVNFLAEAVDVRRRRSVRH
ncbi:MAG TPA: NHL repeat-containing protein [Thermoanaerobaculia bacterium]|nr:NHL repeat-containing protein [Thermoanaerobaculia bacterium]